MKRLYSINKVCREVGSDENCGSKEKSVQDREKVGRNLWKKGTVKKDFFSEILYYRHMNKERCSQEKQTPL
jgi:hypothetical protein